MALSGLHISLHYVGGEGFGKDNLPIPSRAVNSLTMTAAGTSTLVVSASDTVFKGRPIIRLRSSADAWVAFGSAPDATNGPRQLIAASTDYDFFVERGDRVAWILA